MAVFWDVPCSLVEFYRRFRGACYLHYQGDEEVVSTSETSVKLSTRLHGAKSQKIAILIYYRVLSSLPDADKT
jgi:hypothetical protein